MHQFTYIDELRAPQGHCHSAVCVGCVRLFAMRVYASSDSRLDQHGRLNMNVDRISGFLGVLCFYNYGPWQVFNL